MYLLNFLFLFSWKVILQDDVFMAAIGFILDFFYVPLKISDLKILELQKTHLLIF